MSWAAIQAAYGARGVATYPLREDKTPAVRAYHRIGAPYSAQLAIRFPDATAGGFVAGPRNRLTVVDLDSPDEKLVDEIQARYGVTPLWVRTPSGGMHGYYRHNGELRRIRPFPDVDILGAGNVVCAGSKTPKGRYEIERGTLEDLDRLPPLRATSSPAASRERVPVGRRNNELFKYCQSIVGHCDTLDQLLDAARTWADGRLATPLPEAELVKTCNSVWTYRGGRKRVAHQVIDAQTYARLTTYPQAMALLYYLEHENGPDAEFWIADGLGKARGWPKRLVPSARKLLLKLGIVRCVRPRGNGMPALYRWRDGR